MIKLFTLIMVVGFSSQLSAQSKIYKHTDEKGNVHYSDQKPSANAKEADLKSIVVIPAKEFSPAPNRRREAHKAQQAEKKFVDFEIVTPANEATLSGTGGKVLASVKLDDSLPSNYRIEFYIDGLAHGKVESNSQLITGVVRGEHTIYAEMIELSTQRVILTTPTTLFYMRQHSKK